MRTSWSACVTKRLQRTVTWERCFSQAYKKLDVRAMPPHGETPATHFFCVPARTGSNLKIGNGVDQLLPKEMRANRVGCVSVSNRLTRFAKTHWLGHHPQGANLNRKMWHSAIRKMQGTGEAFKALYKIDKHATQTGKTVHCPTAPEGRRSDRVPSVPVLVQRSCCLAECRRSCCSGALVGRFSELRVLSKTRSKQPRG